MSEAYQIRYFNREPGHPAPKQVGVAVYSYGKVDAPDHATCWICGKEIRMDEGGWFDPWQGNDTAHITCTPMFWMAKVSLTE